MPVPATAPAVYVRPAGRVPVSASVTGAVPLVVTAKVNAEPTCAVAVAALVTAGGAALIVMLAPGASVCHAERLPPYCMPNGTLLSE